MAVSCAVFSVDLLVSRYRRQAIRRGRAGPRGPLCNCSPPADKARPGPRGPGRAFGGRLPTGGVTGGRPAPCRTRGGVGVRLPRFGAGIPPDAEIPRRLIERGSLRCAGAPRGGRRGAAPLSRGERGAGLRAGGGADANADGDAYTRAHAAPHTLLYARTIATVTVGSAYVEGATAAAPHRLRGRRRCTPDLGALPHAPLRSCCAPEMSCRNGHFRATGPRRPLIQQRAEQNPCARRPVLLRGRGRAVAGACSRGGVGADAGGDGARGAKAGPHRPIGR